MQETATISLERLKHLELIEKAMFERKTICFSNSSYYVNYYLLDDNETIVKLSEINQQLYIRVNELESEKFKKTIRKKGWFK